MADITTLGMAVDSSGVVRATDDLDKFTKAGEDSAVSATGLEKSLRNATIEGELLGEGIGKLVSQAIDLTRKFFELGLEVGKFADIAIKIGTENPAGLASMQTAADIAGVSIEAVGQSMNRMALRMGQATGPTNEVDRALKSLGINAKEFRALDSAEQFRALAKAVNEYGESQSKVRAVQAITGRGGAEQLLFLHDLGENMESATKLTNEQIKAADALDDGMRKSRSEMKQSAQVIAQGLIPVVTAATQGFHDWIKEVIGVGTEADKLALNNSLTDWARGAVTALSYVGDAVEIEIKGLQVLGRTLAAIFAMHSTGDQMRDLEKQLFGGQISRTEWEKQAKELHERQKDAQKSIIESWTDGMLNIGSMDTTLGAKIRSRLDGIKDAAIKTQKELLHTGEQSLKAVDFDARDKTGGTKEKASWYDKLVESMTKQGEKLQAEIDGEGKLTEAQKIHLQAEQAIDAARRAGLPVSEEQVAMSMVLAQANMRQADALDERKRKDKEATEAAKEKARIDKEIVQLTESLQTPTEKYLVTLEHIVSLESQGLASDTASRARVKAWEDYAAAIDKGKKATDELDEFAKQAARNIQDSLGQTLEDTMHGHFDNILQLWGDMLIKMVAQAAAAQLNRALFGPDFASTGKIGGWIGQLMGLGSSSFGVGGVDIAVASGMVGLAGGGDVAAGQEVIVGEKGPERFRPKVAGTIIPNGASGMNVVMSPVINIDARSDQAQVAQNVRVAMIQSQKALVTELRAQGALR